MKIRQITPNDLSALAKLLTEGFPSSEIDYWRQALCRLSERPRVGDLPQYGLVLETDGALEGVMLMISSRIEDAIFCNLSSWYIREPSRKYAALLFQRSLKFKDVTFTDCSPIPAILPIIETFGFKPYTGGTVTLDLRHAARSSPPVKPLDAKALERIDPSLRATVEELLSYGCEGFLAKDQSKNPVPLLFRTRKVKRVFPVARFVYGDPSDIVNHTGAIMRVLLRRGIPVAFIDWPENTPARLGKLLPRYGVRYSRGSASMDVGNLSQTEVGIFGL